jgi:hypothetical protein
VIRRTIVLLALMAMLIAALAAPAVAKGRPKPKDNASITLEQAAPLHYGDTITFSVQTTTTDRPFVVLECFKGRTLVYKSTVGMFQDWYDEWGIPDFPLSSLAWNGGDADCVAELQYQNRRYRMITLASMEFHVYPA